MEVLKVAPSKGGKNTEVTLSMTAAEATRLAQLLEAGGLAHFNVTDLTISPGPDDADSKRWTGIEASKRKRPPERETP